MGNTEYVIRSTSTYTHNYIKAILYEFWELVTPPIERRFEVWV